MADILLIDETHIAKVRAIAISTNVELQLNPFIREAQDLDIKPILGAETFYDMCNNLLVQKYVDLLDGKTYTSSTGTTVDFKGLRYALSYFAWARYCNRRNVQDTPFGMGAKTTQWSKPTEQKDIYQNSNQDRINGTAYLAECIDFIKTFPLVYTLFAANCGGGIKSLSSVKYITI